MKVRLDFVTNSSSSSFICDICGDNVSGRDICLSDAEMVECVNGHTFCNSHVIRNKENDEWLKEYFTSLGQYDGSSEDVYYDYIEIDDNIWCMSERFCPICSFKNVNKDDAYLFLKKKYGLTDESVLDEIKSGFNDYKSFRKYLDD